MMIKRAYIDTPEGQVHYYYAGAGDPLLMLHAGMYSAMEFVSVIPLFADRYRVIAPDMLGYGNSEINPPDYNIEDYALADIHFMEALGIKKASIVGVHTGALIAMEIAIDRPDMVDKLVLYGIPTFEPDVRAACIKSYTFSPVEIQEDGSHLTSRVWKAVKKIGQRATAENINTVMLEAARAGGGPFHGEHACFRYQETERLPLIKNRTLVISGTGDVFHPALEKISSLIPGKEVKVIEDADAYVTLEKPEEFSKVIIDFLGNK